MRRGIISTLQRALRHGLVVSGVSLAIALVVGLSGALFEDDANRAQAEAARAAADSSSAVVGRWLRPLTDGRSLPLEGNAERVTFAQTAVEAIATAHPIQITVQDATPVPPEARVVAQRLVAPALTPGDKPLATVSFYYCEEAPGAVSRGDGGGFCGIVRDGSMVRPGVAACDVAYLGQRFRIQGDPTGRVYVCADTGSAVHGMHRDIWFVDNRAGWVWQQSVGQRAILEILP